ncbi:MAG: LysM peptidoglycan-binding domain-containing protein [Myxococcota bacterium]
MNLRSVVSGAVRLLTTPQPSGPQSSPRSPPTRPVGHSTVDAFTGPTKGVPDKKHYATTSTGQPVVSQREAGDYYCEHTAWALNFEALKKSSSIRADASGEKLVGFLHIPGGADQPGPNRHTATTEVVGAAFRGYVDTIRGKDPQTNPVKLMLTGYGTFAGVADNPTGDFVGAQANIDHTMRAAFGSSLVSAKGKPISTAAGTAYEYEVKDPKGQTFKVQVLAKKLAVDDASINAGPNSIQRLMKDFQPQAALSLGVNPNEATSYQVVTRADLGGTEFKRGGALRHEGSRKVKDANGDAKETKHAELHNEALGKAILLGQGKYQVRAGDTLASIAARNHTTAEALMKLNGIKDATSLRAGSLILVR